MTTFKKKCERNNLRLALYVHTFLFQQSNSVKLDKASGGALTCCDCVCHVQNWKCSDNRSCLEHIFNHCHHLMYCCYYC